MIRTSERISSHRRGVRALAAVLPMVLAASNALGATSAEKCTAAKIKATAKKLSAKAKCHQKAILVAAPVDAGCLTKAEDRFVVAIGKADLLGPCPGTASGLEASVDSCLDALVAGVAATSTSTSTTTTTAPAAVSTCCETTTACAQVAVADCSLFSSEASPGPAGSWCDAYTGKCITTPSGDLGFCCTPADPLLQCLGGSAVTDCSGVLGIGVCTESGCIDPRS
jgi:hypothetical protein